MVHTFSRDFLSAWYKCKEFGEVVRTQRLKRKKGKNKEKGRQHFKTSHPCIQGAHDSLFGTENWNTYKSKHRMLLGRHDLRGSRKLLHVDDDVEMI